MWNATLPLRRLRNTTVHAGLAHCWLLEPYLAGIGVDERLALVKGLPIVVIYDVKVSGWKGGRVGGVAVMYGYAAEAAVL